MRRAALIAGLVILSVAFVFGDYKDAFAPDIDSPPIEYGTRPTTDAVSQLNLQIQQGKVHLKFDDQQGYLRSVLEALDVPIQSQLVVFSKTSFQMYRISPSNPRSLYFNDSVAVGWVRGGPIVELAAEDPKQGVIFYTLDQKPAQQPQFVRHDDTCLACHESTAAAGVPGMLVRSVYPSASGMPLEELGGYITDDRSPFAQRWGGWYVTGITGSMRHMGNAIVTDPTKPESYLGNQTLNLESLKGKFDTDAYLSPYSDIVALMVFEHEMHVMNLFTRAVWRCATRSTRTARPARRWTGWAQPRQCCAKPRTRWRTPCFLLTRSRCPEGSAERRDSRKCFRRKGRATARGDRCGSSIYESG